ncbi:Uncharacterised protein [Mycobacterium tuberculosis]|nr:Uncharacterised protein [Mycobacterium tuberculosis]
MGDRRRRLPRSQLRQRIRHPKPVVPHHLSVLVPEVVIFLVEVGDLRSELPKRVVVDQNLPLSTVVVDLRQGHHIVMCPFIGPHDLVDLPLDLRQLHTEVGQPPDKRLGCLHQLHHHWTRPGVHQRQQRSVERPLHGRHFHIQRPPRPGGSQHRVRTGAGIYVGGVDLRWVRFEMHLFVRCSVGS